MQWMDSYALWWCEKTAVELSMMWTLGLCKAAWSLVEIFWGGVSNWNTHSYHPANNTALHPSKLESLIFFLRSWDRASLMYLSITNKMQCYTIIFITVNALHVSGSSSTHHQELKTVYTAKGICQAFTALHMQTDPTLLTQTVGRSKSLTNTLSCVYSFELLMMGGGAAWNV